MQAQPFSIDCVEPGEKFIWCANSRNFPVNIEPMLSLPTSYVLDLAIADYAYCYRRLLGQPRHRHLLTETSQFMVSCRDPFLGDFLSNPLLEAVIRKEVSRVQSLRLCLDENEDFT